VTTIGVSVAVPDPCGNDLQEYRVQLGDPTAAGIPTHVTLLPPIDVDDVLLPSINGHLEKVAAATCPFEMHLRGTGSFRPVSPVVFVNVVQGISSCELLASAVRQGPLAIDAQFPYHPHVTVAHHLAEELLDQAFDELGSFDCRFTVDQISLYEHRDDRGWTPVRAFTLGGTEAGRSTQQVAV
jgi:2'-5' RNA ligase